VAKTASKLNNNIEQARPTNRASSNKKVTNMTFNPTKEEIDALEREIQQQRKKREKHLHRAVNPGR
jgi:hypothetical protein